MATTQSTKSLCISDLRSFPVIVGIFNNLFRLQTFIVAILDELLIYVYLFKPTEHLVSSNKLLIKLKRLFTRHDLYTFLYVDITI